jgi:flavin-dependent dehydrogenase
MTTDNTNVDVAIAGAGPAGTSAAIHLALAGLRVLLVEEKKFPRAKLCGEFISPECIAHFQRLGVAEQMIAAGAASLSQTIFYSRKGRSVAVPSEWFSPTKAALGLSRSEMDNTLLDRAKAVGVIVLENAHASGLLTEGNRVTGMRLKLNERQDEKFVEYRASITVDATGRARALARHVDSVSGKKVAKRQLVAFKAHLKNTDVAAGACEIYFYPGGYGGLSSVEAGLSNLCFIVSAEDVRRYRSIPERVMREVVMKNARAERTLEDAEVCTPWLSVALEGFGRRGLAPAPGLITVGDAASFIDPFTGSGMLMALESGEVAAGVITRNLKSLRTGFSLESVSRDYQAEYLQRFDSRLRIAGLIRRAAFMPRLAETAIVLFGMSSRVRRRVARSTRQAGQPQLTRAAFETVDSHSAGVPLSRLK